MTQKPATRCRAVDTVERAPDPLLSLPRVGCVATSRRSALHQPTGSAGPPGWSPLERGDAVTEDPTVIQQELDWRLAVARAADPAKHRERTVQRDLVRVDESIERMLTAYQEIFCRSSNCGSGCPRRASNTTRRDFLGLSRVEGVWRRRSPARGIDVAGSHVWLEERRSAIRPYGLVSRPIPTMWSSAAAGFSTTTTASSCRRAAGTGTSPTTPLSATRRTSTESLDGEGIDLNVTGGHTVAHNSITNVADGVSYPARQRRHLRQRHLRHLGRRHRARLRRAERAGLGQPYPQRGAQRHQLPAAERRAVVHHPQPDRRQPRGCRSSSARRIASCCSTTPSSIGGRRGRATR